MPPLIEREAIQQFIASDLMFRAEAHVIWGATEKTDKRQIRDNASLESCQRYRYQAINETLAPYL